MWLRTENNLINLDRIYYFNSNIQSDKTAAVYADSIPVCICHPDEVQPLLHAIADALIKKLDVFYVVNWLDYSKTMYRRGGED